MLHALNVKPLRDGLKRPTANDLLPGLPPRHEVKPRHTEQEDVEVWRSPSL
jgi:hypothetical protein